jgi:hypothetical protein
MSKRLVRGRGIDGGRTPLPLLRCGSGPGEGAREFDGILDGGPDRIAEAQRTYLVVKKEI